MTTNLTLSTTSITLHNKKTNPIFGDGVLCIRLDDEGAGMFIVISQDGSMWNSPYNSEVRIDFDEVPLLVQAIKRLKIVADKIEKDAE